MGKKAWIVLLLLFPAMSLFAVPHSVPYAVTVCFSADVAKNVSPEGAHPNFQVSDDGCAAQALGVPCGIQPKTAMASVPVSENAPCATRHLNFTVSDSSVHSVAQNNAITASVDFKLKDDNRYQSVRCDASQYNLSGATHLYFSVQQQGDDFTCVLTNQAVS